MLPSSPKPNGTRFLIAEGWSYALTALIAAIPGVMSLSNPLNLILIPPILYLLYRIFVPSPASLPKSIPSTYNPAEYNWLPASHPPTILFKDYTTRELQPFGGKSGDRILLAILRVGRELKVDPKAERTVFDVTSGRGFYGPGGWIPVPSTENIPITKLLGRR